jgi:hypothetical protein
LSKWLALSIKSIPLTAALFLFAWMGAGLYMVSLDSYTPQPGTLNYYLGISRLVRNVPLVNNLEPPVFYGTVGDGAMSPHTVVSYPVAAVDAQAAKRAVERYLFERDFRATESLPSPPREPGDPVVEQRIYQSTWTSPSGELVIAELSALPGTQQIRLSVTHYD